MFSRMRLFLLFILCVIFLTSSKLYAFGATGNHSIGGNFVLVSADQTDLNSLIKNANTASGGISTSELKNAYELNFIYSYKFYGSIFGFQFRPSVFYQNTEGTGSGGSYDYSLVGYTLFPTFRIVPLENHFIKFFMHIGLGYGVLYGRIEEGPASLKYKGSAFGFMAGIGAEFCFTENHCLNLEGNFRYMPVERNLATSYSGSFIAGSITQPNASTADPSGTEVEIDNEDMKTSMSGLQAVIGYVYHF